MRPIVCSCHWVHRLALVALIASGALTHAQDVSIPASTPLPVELVQHVPMKDGQPLQARLLYPVYAENRVAIPAGSMLYGRVVQLRADRSHRIHSRLWGDFTPFHIPVVRFERLVLPNGTSLTVVSSDATDGAPILHLSAPTPKPKKSIVSEQMANAKQRVKDEAALFTAPDRKDRLVQFLYRQLPYHPERIQTGTAWTVELAQPLHLSSVAEAAKASDDPPPTQVSTQPASQNVQQPDKPQDQSTTWRLKAYLDQTLSSANTKQGQTFDAVVAEPVFKTDRTVAVPQGSRLIGTVTQSKPARSFGRKGKLRFSFRELKLPDAPSRPVEGSLAAADSNSSQDLQLDSEGGVQQKSQNRIIVPVVLTILASRALDSDSSAAGGAAVGSNGFGIIGRIVGIAASSRNLAAGIGFYGAALSFYSRWIARGQDVT
ncbi:MAG TPA: hypothetical protein VGM27_23820, partial [Acidobacteriaceae bacterium]